MPGTILPAAWTLQPESGTKPMFPSWLLHGVLPYFGEGPRISIAFNLCVNEPSLQRPPDGR